MANASTDGQQLLVHEMYRALSCDDFDPSLNNVVFRCLSIQASLGLKGSNEARDRSSIVPWLMLNLRQTVSVLISIYKELRNDDPSTFPPTPTPDIL